MTGAGPLPGPEAGVPYSLEGVGLIARVPRLGSLEAAWTNRPEVGSESYQRQAFNARLRRERCETGYTGYLIVGTNVYDGQERVCILRCKQRWCKSCALDRGRKVFAIVRRWLEANDGTSIMLTLTLERGPGWQASCLALWSMLRSFWAKFCRRIYGLERCRRCKEVRERQCRNCGRLAGAIQERSDRSCGHSSAAHVWLAPRYPKGACDGRAHSWGTPPYAAILEPQKDRTPHLHLAIAAGFLQSGPGARDGVAIAYELWNQTVSKRRGVRGGFVWLTFKSGSGDPARYCSKYVSKGASWPEEMKEFLSIRRVRTFNATHRVRDAEPTPLEDYWEWRVQKEDDFLRERATRDDRRQVMQVMDRMYVFKADWDIDTGERVYTKECEGPAPN